MKMRLYVDTSVFGGCFEEKHKEDTIRFFDYIYKGSAVVVVSQITVGELQPAPDYVRKVYDKIPDKFLETVDINEEVIKLRNLYLEQKILTKQWINDATQVAAATVYRVDAIVSWNFKHIVKLEKMKKFNQVNFSRGYGILTIVSPREVGFE